MRRRIRRRARVLTAGKSAPPRRIGCKPIAAAQSEKTSIRERERGLRRGLDFSPLSGGNVCEIARRDVCEDVLDASVGLVRGFVRGFGVEDAFAQSPVVGVDVEAVFFDPRGDGFGAIATEFVVRIDGADGIGVSRDVELHHDAVVLGLSGLDFAERVNEF